MSESLTTFQLRNLPPYGKTFVGVFTALMLCVCIWAVWIYTARYGRVDTEHLPAYLQKNDLKADIEELKHDSNAVMAPVWGDSTAGEERPIDSATIEAIKKQSLQVSKNSSTDPDDDLGLAHTHINGQTLLFFALGLAFLFSSATAKVKKIIYWLFGVLVVTHNLGLSFRSCGGVWGDLLAVSGVGMLLLIAYISFVIFSDLVKSPRELS
jgi:hypothetical protein